MYGNGGDSGMYVGMFCWVIMVFVRCCCNKVVHFFAIKSLFLEVGLVGL